MEWLLLLTDPMFVLLVRGATFPFTRLRLTCRLDGDGVNCACVSSTPHVGACLSLCVCVLCVCVCVCGGCFRVYEQWAGSVQLCSENVRLQTTMRAQ